VQANLLQARQNSVAYGHCIGSCCGQIQVVEKAPA